MDEDNDGRFPDDSAVEVRYPFWLAIIDGLAGVSILPTVIGIARQVEGLGLVGLPERVPGRVACGAGPGLHDAAGASPVAAARRLRQDAGAPPSRW